MANVTKPIALDETFNTTESTPRNLADVLAEGLGDIANNVKPDASDITLDPITGMSATNVQSGISELKGTLDDKVDNTNIISGTKSVTAAAGAYGYESVSIPWNTTNYSVVLTIGYGSNFTKASLAYDNKANNSVRVGFYNNGSSSLTLNVDYIIIKHS